MLYWHSRNSLLLKLTCFSLPSLLCIGWLSFEKAIKGGFAKSYTRQLCTRLYVSLNSLLSFSTTYMSSLFLNQHQLLHPI
ncbi:hypothetical protein AB4K20DRAFT_1884767 [Rhizopus microsporus]